MNKFCHRNTIKYMSKAKLYSPLQYPELLFFKFYTDIRRFFLIPIRKVSKFYFNINKVYYTSSLSMNKL